MRSVAVACLAVLILPPAAAAAGLPGGRAIAVTTSVSPDVHLFAEPIAVRVRVVVDRRRFDPERIEVRTGFAPYEPLGPGEETRRTIGDIVELTYSTRLRCLGADCIAERFKTALGEQEGGRAERYTFRFRPAEVVYRHPGGRFELLLQRPVPPVEVVSRINTAQLDEAEATGSSYAASLDPPPVTYRLSPGLQAAAALALAGVLLLLPGMLAGRTLLARWRASRRPRRLTPLERALLLVDWSARQPDGEEDRRRALEALADVLERGGALPLAESTRNFAWAEAAPAPERADQLAGEARSVLRGGRNGRAR